MTYVIKVKCMRCGLHFAAYSWSEEWSPRYCPECGEKTRFMIWQEQLEDQIFEHIPGSSPLQSIELPIQ